ncbi:hypothetical protein ARSEF4850_003541 [Beauveria asiatica]
MEMEDPNFEFLDEYDLRTPGRDRSPSVNTSAEKPNRADAGNTKRNLPLQRLNNWESDRHVAIPNHILEQVLARSDDSPGDPVEELNKYFTFLLAEVQSDRSRAELEVGMKFARDQCFELNSMEEHPQMVVTAMVRGNVKIGSAVHLVGGIKRYKRAASIMRRRD